MSASIPPGPLIAFPFFRPMLTTACVNVLVVDTTLGDPTASCEPEKLDYRWYRFARKSLWPILPAMGNHNTFQALHPTGEIAENSLYTGRI